MSELDDIFEDLKHITDCVVAYRRIINMPNCNDCGTTDCEVKPKWYDPGTLLTKKQLEVGDEQ